MVQNAEMLAVHLHCLTRRRDSVRNGTCCRLELREKLVCVHESAVRTEATMRPRRLREQVMLHPRR